MTTSPQPLTARQRQLLMFLVRFTERHGYQPCIRSNILPHMGITSTNGAMDHMRALESKGYIMLSNKYKARAVVILRDHHGRPGRFVWTPTEDTP